jgi:hypothetical protein
MHHRNATLFYPRRRRRLAAWTRCSFRFVLTAMLLCQAYGYAQLGPQPPCGTETVPPYPGLNSSPIVKFWSKSDYGHDWKPPACTGWAEAGFSTLVTTVARFRHTSGAEGLLRHIGAISELAGMRYWSTTHKRWQTLIVDAYASTGLQPNQRRGDFTPNEMKEGKVLTLDRLIIFPATPSTECTSQRLRQTGLSSMSRMPASFAICL